MLNDKIFQLFWLEPGTGYVIPEGANLHERVSKRAWSYACEASSQETFMDEPVWQDDILSVVEEGALCVVTLGRKDGSVYQSSVNLDEYYAGCVGGSTSY